MNYDVLRHFADSWGLVIMTVMFLSFVGWTFRPNARRDHRRAAHSIFEDGNRNDG
ncbi:cbb3-type cytochrome c oxidase subunit 3 [Sphingomonas sp. G-3-2-10]|uniref:CcoQ/FixQ family Cbb3-type cytochrome c oxidase assembly chaperone n=1 Tax=Sphingomonas sp. G-3-2-10 TaxID=2728838 RepID=UPI00146DB3C1|nr:cbb3-type cytochrome c oxidase subunit 3 [Sphingomonas sp. G-3-2-10]